MVRIKIRIIDGIPCIELGDELIEFKGRLDFTAMQRLKERNFLGEILTELIRKFKHKKQ